MSVRLSVVQCELELVSVLVLRWLVRELGLGLGLLSVRRSLGRVSERLLGH